MRRLLLLAMAVCSFAVFAFAAPAMAFPPNAQTQSPTNVTNDGATLNGYVYMQQVSPTPATATYHFEYGVTSALGSVTQEKPAPAVQPGSPPPTVSERVGLPGDSKFFFRIVGTNEAGEKGYGQTIEWKTPGPPPAGPGTKRTTAKVGPGGSISTGSDPSKSNPIVAKAISEKGGTLWIDEISNPDRPGEAPSCADEPANPDCQESNPEDDRSKEKHWYGPAFRVTPSEGSGKTTIVFTIHGGTDLLDPRERLASLYENPTGVPSGCARASARKLKFKRLANGDTQITQVLVLCGTGDVPVFNFYNPPWQVRLGEYFGVFSNDLNAALDRGNIPFGLHCVLKCARTVSASIAEKSAEKLGLKSGDLGTVKTTFGEEWNYKYPLRAKVRKAFRRITRNGGQITINFRAKAVGPGGQVFKKRTSAKMKGESNSDSF